jgi:molybdopterin converting factor subunit 1
MKVLFFAQSRDAAGCVDYLLKVAQPVTEAEFWALLIEAFPALASQQKSARLARHGAYLQKHEILNPDDEIAIIPPVSGG